MHRGSYVMNTSKNKICTPRVVLIASEILLLDDSVRTFAEKPVISVPVICANDTIANWLSSAVTGVDTLTHGITHGRAIEPSTLQIRAVEADDRLFPAFWNTSAEEDLRTHVIDWPATNGDEDISQLNSIDELNRSIRETAEVDDESIASRAVSAIEQDEIRTIIQANIQNLLGRTRQTFAIAMASITSQERPDAMAILLRSAKHKDIDQTELTARTSELLKDFIATLTQETIILLLQRDSSHHKDDSDVSTRSRLAIIGGEHEPNNIRTINVRSIASVIRTVLGLPLPMGTVKYSWPFLRIDHNEDPNWTIPNNTKSNETDYEDVATRIMAARAEDTSGQRKKNVPRNILLNQLRTLIRKAKSQNNWHEMARFSRAALVLSRTPGEYWSMVIAAHSAQFSEELSKASAAFIEAYPEIPEAQLGEAIALMPTNPERAEEILEKIDENTLKSDFARNILGRLVLKTDNPARGEAVIRQALANKKGMPIDHIALAHFLHESGKPEEAMDAIGPIGKVNAPVKWQLLRTRILIDCGLHKEAQSAIDAILELDPTNSQANRLATLIGTNSPSE